MFTYGRAVSLAVEGHRWTIHLEGRSEYTIRSPALDRSAGSTSDAAWCAQNLLRLRCGRTPPARRTPLCGRSRCLSAWPVGARAQTLRTMDANFEAFDTKNNGRGPSLGERIMTNAPTVPGSSLARPARSTTKSHRTHPDSLKTYDYGTSEHIHSHVSEADWLHA